MIPYFFICASRRGFLPAVIPGHAHSSQQVDPMGEGERAQETQDTLPDHL